MEPEGYYRIYKSPPTVPISSQMNTVHSTAPLLEDALLIIQYYQHLGLPSGFLSQGHPTKILYAPLLSPLRAPCRTHLILLDFITQIPFGEEYRSSDSSLCSLLQFPVTASLLGSIILLSILFSNILSLRSSPNISEWFHIHTK